jgi:hypothetical protein
MKDKKEKPDRDDQYIKIKIPVGAEKIIRLTRGPACYIVAMCFLYLLTKQFLLLYFNQQ